MGYSEELKGEVVDAGGGVEGGGGAGGGDAYAFGEEVGGAHAGHCLQNFQFSVFGLECFGGVEVFGGFGGGLVEAVVAPGVDVAQF